MLSPFLVMSIRESVRIPRGCRVLLFSAVGALFLKSPILVSPFFLRFREARPMVFDFWAPFFRVMQVVLIMSKFRPFAGQCFRTGS